MGTDRDDQKQEDFYKIMAMGENLSKAENS